MRENNRLSSENEQQARNKIHILQTEINQIEQKLFSQKQSIVNLTDENEQINVDLSYVKANAQNQ